MTNTIRTSAAHSDAPAKQQQHLNQDFSKNDSSINGEVLSSSSTTISFRGKKDPTSETKVGDVATAPSTAFESIRRWTTVMVREALPAFVMGIIFALVLERSGILAPSTIRNQMVFKREAMLKMWLSGVIGSSLVFATASYFVPELFQKLRNARSWNDKGVITSVTGGLIQGAGMGLAGACPGMTMAQVGAGYPFANYTFVGAILGASAYNFLHPLIDKSMKRDFEVTLGSKISHGYLDMIFKWSYTKSALIMALALASFVAAVDFFIPWQTDLTGVLGVRTVEKGLLNPIIAGLAVGALQTPAFFGLNTFLGTSTAYSIVTSQWARFAPISWTQCFKYADNQCRSSQYWQVFYGLGAAFGGYLVSSGATHYPPTLPNGVGAFTGLLGGFLLMFGARLSGGCATGHGLSGIGLLAVPGFLVIPAVFGGGIATVTLAKFLLGPEFLLE